MLSSGGNPQRSGLCSLEASRSPHFPRPQKYESCLESQVAFLRSSSPISSLFHSYKAENLSCLTQSTGSGMSLLCWQVEERELKRVGLPQGLSP